MWHPLLLACLAHSWLLCSMCSCGMLRQAWSERHWQGTEQRLSHSTSTQQVSAQGTGMMPSAVMLMCGVDTLQCLAFLMVINNTYAVQDFAWCVPVLLR
jgi:hypothetical protein